MKTNKQKKEYKFYNIVVDDEILNSIHETKSLGYNWQTLIRNFIREKAEEIREANGKIVSAK